jgi:hypothetical protein
MGMGMAINTAQLSVYLLCEAGMHELGINWGDINTTSYWTGGFGFRFSV